MADKSAIILKIYVFRCEPELAAKFPGHCEKEIVKMCIKKISIKKNKTPGRFLLVQIILCILIIVSIFTEENTIFRDDLNQAK